MDACRQGGKQMQQNNLAAAGRQYLDLAPELKEIVMGLHWDPSDDAGTCPEDLDAVCLLLDTRHHALDVIHPGNPRNADSSVVHTGDSRTGASEWDDERIFVFLPALPAAVSAVAFVVHSASERPFGGIRGASCHVSDHATEYKWIDVQLTELHDQTSHFVALLTRDATGWGISAEEHAIPGDRLANLIALAKAKKNCKS